MIVFSMFGCNNSNEPAQPKDILPVENLTVADIGNNANGADMEVSFSKPSDVTQVAEFRVLTVRSDQSDSFDLSVAENVLAGNYFAIDVNGFVHQIHLPSTANDVDGDAVTNDTPYKVFVLSVAKTGTGLANVLSPGTNEITLLHKSAIRNLTKEFEAGSGGMDTDKEGFVYMADFGPGLTGVPGTKVYKISLEGEVTLFASGFLGASGNDFDSDGNLYQSNIQSNEISKISPDGTVTKFADSGDGPVGIVVDPKNDDVYVCNCRENTITKITQNNTSSVFASGELFRCPNGIDMDKDGNLFVANFGNGDVLKITPSGEVSVFTTIPGNNNGHLLFRGDDLFVVARGDHRIYRIIRDGEFEIYVGNGSRGNVNGDLINAQLSLPNDISFSPDGKFMYINDVALFDENDTNTLSPVIIRVVEIVDQ